MPPPPPAPKAHRGLPQGRGRAAVPHPLVVLFGRLEHLGAGEAGDGGTTSAGKSLDGRRRRALEPRAQQLEPPPHALGAPAYPPPAPPPRQPRPPPPPRSASASTRRRRRTSGPSPCRAPCGASSDAAAGDALGGAARRAACEAPGLFPRRLNLYSTTHRGGGTRGGASPTHSTAPFPVSVPPAARPLKIWPALCLAEGPQTTPVGPLPGRCPPLPGADRRCSTPRRRPSLLEL
jgi:hypothetical protein